MKVSFNPLMSNIRLNGNVNINKYGLRIKNQMSLDTVSFGANQNEFPDLYIKSRYMSIYE